MILSILLLTFLCSIGGECDLNLVDRDDSLILNETASLGNKRSLLTVTKQFKCRPPGEVKEQYYFFTTGYVSLFSNDVEFEMKRIHSSKNRGGQHVKTVIYQQGSAESIFDGKTEHRICGVPNLIAGKQDADYCCLRLYDMTAFKSYSSRIHYNVDMELINCENDATQDECFESPKETVVCHVPARFGIA